MTFRDFFLILVCAAATTLSMVMFRNVLGGNPTFKDSPLTGLFQSLPNPKFWFGVVLFVTANGLWLYIVSTQTLITCYPSQIGLVFLFNTLSSTLIFRETLRLPGFVGLILILAGITLTPSYENGPTASGNPSAPVGRTHP